MNGAGSLHNKITDSEMEISMHDAYWGIISRFTPTMDTDREAT